MAVVIPLDRAHIFITDSAYGAAGHRYPEEGKSTMTHLMTYIRDAVAKRADYNRTAFALESMSRETAWDIGIFREDARQIAHRSVYGH